MSLNNIIEKWLEDTTQMLDIHNLGLTEWPKQLVGKENLIKTLWCSHNQLFSDELEKWKKIWPISIRHQRVLRTAGIKRVVKVLKNRLYLPSLNELREELIWSPNHPGKFFTSLPRAGNW